MAAINFLTGGYNTSINNLSGSGLGFFGSAGFGNSVPVGQYQGTTFITDGNGINQGPQANNVAYLTSQSGIVPTNVNIALQSIPNYQGTLNIRFTNSTAVRTQNAQLYIYDRTSTSNPPSGVLCYVAQLIHPNQTQGVGGSGDASWQAPAGTSYLPASFLYNGNAFSPGTSGFSPNGGNTIDTQHDWYFAISASPTTVGAKTLFGLWWQNEYL